MDVTRNAFGVDASDVRDAFEDEVDKVAHQQFIRCLQHPEHLDALADAATRALETAGLSSLPTEFDLFATLSEPLFLATMTALNGATKGGFHCHRLESVS